MASLPALPSLAALRRKRNDNASADDLTAEADAKLNLARRLQAEDDARRATSVAPPATSARRSA
jgi:hypothetical protein